MAHYLNDSARLGWAIRRALMTILTASHPQSSRAHFALGNACRARQEKQCAVAAYEEALRRDPTLHEARVGLITTKGHEDAIHIMRGSRG